MKLSDVDLRLLRVFRTVAETGGFSQAALALNVGTSTISTHMADLERRLGFRLCERGRSGFAMTEKGQQALELTLTLSSAFDDFAASIGAVQGKITGRLNIGLIDYMTSVPGFRIADVMREFSHVASEATLNLQVLPEADLIRGILDSRIHIGIGPNQIVNTGLNFQPFLSEISQLYCGKNHPLYPAVSRRLIYEDIYKYRFAGNRMQEHRDSTQRWVAKDDAHGNNLETVAILILSGEYLGHLPTHFAEQWSTTDEMRALRPDLISIPQDLKIVTRATGHQSSLVKEFLRILINLCR